MQSSQTDSIHSHREVPTAAPKDPARDLEILEVLDDGEPTRSDGKASNVWQAMEGPGRYYPVEATIPRLHTKRYKPRWDSNRGSLYIARAKVVTDRLFPSSMVDTVMQEIRAFWSQKDDYAKFGFVWRRNFLLWGPPDTGKSCILEGVTRYFLEQDGLVLNYDQQLPPGIGGTLATVRKWEPGRPILLLLEDLDASIEAGGPGFEQELLQFLDGAARVENVVTLATTNFPKKLSQRILRPGRFDEIYHIPQPDRKSKIGYLRSFEETYFTEPILEDWLRETQGFTFADLKEAVLQVLIKKRTLQEACKILRQTNRCSAPLNPAEEKPLEIGAGRGQYV